MHHSEIESIHLCTGYLYLSTVCTNKVLSCIAVIVFIVATAELLANGKQRNSFHERDKGNFYEILFSFFLSLFAINMCALNIYSCNRWYTIACIVLAPHNRKSVVCTLQTQIKSYLLLFKSLWLRVQCAHCTHTHTCTPNIHAFVKSFFAFVSIILFHVHPPFATRFYSHFSFSLFYVDFFLSLLVVVLNVWVHCVCTHSSQLTHFISFHALLTITMNKNYIRLHVCVSVCVRGCAAYFHQMLPHLSLSRHL